MRKSSCALPRGFAAVAERQGEGKRVAGSCRAQLWSGAASHPGMLLGGCASRSCRGQELLRCAQLRFKAGLTAL